MGQLSRIVAVLSVLLLGRLAFPELVTGALSNVGYILWARSVPMESNSLLPDQRTAASAQVWWQAPRTIGLLPSSGGLRGLAMLKAAQGRWAEAELAWSAGLIDPELLLGHGLAALQAGHYDRALRFFEIASHLAPGSSDAWYLIGQALEGTERWGEALSAYERALRVGDFNRFGASSALVRKGVIYYGTFHLRRMAKQALDEAIETDDFVSTAELADAYYLRGITEQDLGASAQTVIVEFERSVALDPTHYWCWLRLGQARYWMIGDLEGAKRDIDRALEVWPLEASRKWPHLFLGDIYRDAGLLEDARQAYWHAWSIDPTESQTTARISAIAQ